MDEQIDKREDFKLLQERAVLRLVLKLYEMQRKEEKEVQKEPGIATRRLVEALKPINYAAVKTLNKAEKMGLITRSYEKPARGWGTKRYSKLTAKGVRIARAFKDAADYAMAAASDEQEQDKEKQVKEYSLVKKDNGVKKSDEKEQPKKNKKNEELRQSGSKFVKIHPKEEMILKFNPEKIENTQNLFSMVRKNHELDIQ